MIWGDVINAVRKIHLDLVQECSVPPALVSKDLELAPAEIPFPEAVDDFDEWEETPLPAELQDVIPLHSVERALVEGPVLPIQHVRFVSSSGIESLFASVLALEKDWLTRAKLLTPDRVRFLENAIAVQALKLSVRAGFRSLKPMKEI
ncbi:MAG: hypothetical protein EBX52_10910 [Proteobacteria bacterium]|nr:hypothetical protein [Pseudomonadota bacterium]